MNHGSAGEWWGYELISSDFCLASRPSQKQLRDFRSLCAFPWKGQFNCGTFPCFVLSWILLQWSAHVNKTADKTIDSIDDTVSWLGHQLALFSLVSCFHHFCSILYTACWLWVCVWQCSLMFTRQAPLVGLSCHSEAKCKVFFFFFCVLLWKEYDQRCLRLALLFFFSHCHLQKSRCRLSKDSTRRARSNHIL